MVRRFGFYMGAALFVSVAWPVTPSQAGFEFIAPINQEPAQQQAPRQGDQKPILERSDVEPLLPLMSTKDIDVEIEPLSVLPNQMEAKPTPPPAPMAVIEKDIPPVMSAPKAPAQSSVGSISNASVVVEGFANQIPLVIALQQVIPAQYQYAFADGVNAGEKVDWQGGKPWDQVVSDMVADKDMDVEISGNVVYIRRRGMANTMPAAMPKSVAKAPMVEEKIPLLPSANARPAPNTARAANSILFDSPEMADLSGVIRATPQPSMKSERLALDDLSIGQPMALVPSTQKKTTIAEPAKKIITEKKILTLSEAENTPIFDQKMDSTETTKSENTIDILPKAAPIPLSPVMDKKILLLDEMPVKPVTEPLFPDNPVDLSKSITPIEKLPEGETVAMSEAMMSIMKPTTTISGMGSALWQANSGETLRSVLEKWANEAQTSLIWESNYDYPLQADIEISGTFENAVRTLLDGLSDANPRPLGRLHRNAPSGQPVLVIETEALTN